LTFPKLMCVDEPKSLASTGMGAVEFYGGWRSSPTRQATKAAAAEGLGPCGYNLSSHDAVVGGARRWRSSREAAAGQAGGRSSFRGHFWTSGGPPSLKDYAKSLQEQPIFLWHMYKK
jgi:hypothetical protein